MVSITAASDVFYVPMTNLDSSAGWDEELEDFILVNSRLAIVCRVAERHGPIGGSGNYLLDSRVTFDVVDLPAGTVAKSISFQPFAGGGLTANGGPSLFLFKIDANTVGFVGSGTSPIDPVTFTFEGSWLVGTVTIAGRVSYNVIPYQSPAGVLSTNNPAQRSAFAHSKGFQYSCWDPVNRTVAVQNWVTYNHRPVGESYGTSFNVDTLALVDQWRIWPAQRGEYFPYYESFATTLPGLHGALGMETEDGLGEANFHLHGELTHVWLVNGNRERLYKFPMRPGTTDVNDAWIVQVPDNPNLVSVAVQSYPLGDDSNSGRTEVAIVQVYPTLKLIRPPVLVGEYYGGARAESRVSEFWTYGLYDQVRQITAKYVAGASYSQSGSSFFLPNEFVTNGPLIGFRSLYEPQGIWGSHVLQTGESTRYNRQGTFTSFLDDYCLVGSIGDDRGIFQLLKLSPRGLGNGASARRSVTFD